MVSSKKLQGSKVNIGHSLMPYSLILPSQQPHIREKAVILVHILQIRKLI
jgi:hypothetical protein